MTKLARMRDWARARARRDTSGSSRKGSDPALSIVVPVYNVAPYLRECLDSVVAQPYDDYEVVMVDDGSTDDSAAIAQDYVARDARFRLVSQTNAGLGAARNAGVREARGTYLTFLDSDDRLPHDAYSAMVGTLEQSGSDFAIGMLKRDEGGRRFAMPRMRDNHRVQRVGITLDEMPRILADVFAVNKVFRRSFWEAAGLAFPVGLRYEDQPTLTQAFLAAGTFDVLRETVYLWRIREDLSSITQRRHHIEDLRDRILTKRISTELLEDKAPHLRDLWLSDILPVDMWEYFRAAPDSSDDYWRLLRAAMAEFWSEATVPFDRTWVPVQHRCMGWLVVQDRRQQLEELVDFVDAHRGDLPVEVRGDKVVALLPGVDGPSSDLPETVYVLGEHELRWETRITRAAWDGDLLRLTGFALMRNVPTDGHTTTLRARLELVPDRAAGAERGDVAEHPVAVRQERQPRATRFVGRPSQDYDDCGFSATIDVASLAGRPDGSSLWRLALERSVEGVSGSGGVTSFDRPDVDLGWHRLDGRVDDADPRDVGGAGPSRARLRQVDDELVLEIGRPRSA